MLRHMEHVYDFVFMQVKSSLSVVNFRYNLQKRCPFCNKYTLYMIWYNELNFAHDFVFMNNQSSSSNINLMYFLQELPWFPFILETYKGSLPPVSVRLFVVVILSIKVNASDIRFG